MQIGRMWPTEIVRVGALQRAVLNDTNGAQDAEWEAGLSLCLFLSLSPTIPLSLSYMVSSFMDFFYRCAGGP